MTDQEIIRHLQHNKYSMALKGLYHILPEATKYIRSNNGTADDAEDIFQDALVILYKKVHGENFNLTVPLKTYLLAILRNRWLQELRQRKKFPLADEPADIVAENINEEPGFLSATAAFNLLGEKCRQLLILFYFHKKNFKEIAAELAFSDELVAKNQKYRCMQKAKENYLNLINNSHE